MQHYHAVVWVDHKEARVFFFDRDSFNEVDIASKSPHHNLHHKAGNVSGKRAPEDQDFFHEIVRALNPAKEWLITGPGSAKLELMKHINRHDHEMSDYVVGIETADHPTDNQIVAHARSFFKAADRMRPQI
jgi:stalled ribosome rescue protein Dom34